ncbi:hypothetical protein MNBD_GAMMA26-1476 [hydrothermal vent metagenome]|uniref:Transporter n=1 Tax=hydrothermal vent metagenome TaxID=652676 RepID=A0A3B1BEZ2_9ZZZZ
MRKILLSGLLLALPISSVQAYVGLCCGKCGGNMPMNIPGAGVPETKEVRIKASTMFMSMKDLQDKGDDLSSSDVLGMPAMGKFMAAPTRMDMRMFNLTLGYSFTDDLFGGVMLMHKENRMDMKFNTMMAGMTGQNGFTMESTGIADTMLMGKYRLFADDPLIPTRQVSLFFGLNLPTGSIDKKNSDHPLAMRKTELLPYSMQLGSGTFDPSLGILYQGSNSPYWWGVNTTYTARLYENDRDYRLGNELKLDLYGMYQFRYNLLGQIQINGKHWGRIKGEMDESKTGESGRAIKNNPSSPFMTPQWDPDNYGGSQLMTTIGLQWQPVPLHIIDFNVGIPLYQRLNGPQLEEKYRVMLTWYMEIPTLSSIRHLKHKTKPSRLGF